MVGRPREHDRDQIAKDLIEWAKLESSINFNKFCCTREPPIPASKLLLWAKENDGFRTAYETAKAFLGCRREEWLSSERLHVKAYDLNATVYDLIAKDEKIENMKMVSDLSKDTEKSKQNITINLTDYSKDKS
jgi:hypothetical protein